MTDSIPSDTPPGHWLPRMLQLVEVLSDTLEPMTLTQLSRQLRYPKSTVHRMITIFTGLDIVIQEANGYVLGSYLSDLVTTARVTRLNEIKRSAMPYLVELYEATRGAVSLGVLEAANVVYLETVVNHVHAPAISGSSQRAPAHCTSMGKLLLAYQNDDPVDLDAATLTKFTPRTKTDAGLLRAELHTIRKRGMAFSTDEYVIGTAGVAVPILLNGAVPLLGLSVSGSSDHLNFRRATHAVVRTASAITAALEKAALGRYPAERRAQ